MIIARHNCDSVENIEKCEKGQHRKYTCTQDIYVCLFVYGSGTFYFCEVHSLLLLLCRPLLVDPRNQMFIKVKKTHYMRYYARLVPKIEVL